MHKSDLMRLREEGPARTIHSKFMKLSQWLTQPHSFLALSTLRVLVSTHVHNLNTSLKVSIASAYLISLSNLHMSPGSRR